MFSLRFAYPLFLSFSVRHFIAFVFLPFPGSPFLPFPLLRSPSARLGLSIPRQSGSSRSRSHARFPAACFVLHSCRRISVRAARRAVPVFLCLYPQRQCCASRWALQR